LRAQDVATHQRHVTEVSQHRIWKSSQLPGASDGAGFLFALARLVAATCRIRRTMSGDGNMATDVTQDASRREAFAWADAGVVPIILATVALGYALTVLVFYPGYATIDAQYVYAESRSWRFGDWQSPVMGFTWWLIDPLAPGAFSMFLLVTTLYWLGFGALALILARRLTVAGIVTPLLAFAPPAFLFVGMIWRDVLLGAVWLTAAVLAFAVADRAPRVRCPAQMLALLLLAFGVLLRPNAIVAAPVLAAYLIWPARIDLKRAALAFVPVFVALYALVPAVYYGILDAQRQNPVHSILVFDLGGITHFTGINQFPVEWSPEQAALLTSKCYDPQRWDTYWFIDPCSFVMKRLGAKEDAIFGTPQLPQAWRQAVAAHPLAYLQHRATYMWQFIARPNLVWPHWDWERPDATYGKSPYFRPLLALHGTLERTVLFRPALWLILALAVCAFAWPARTAPAGAFALGASASAVVYVMSFLVFGVAADFRYAYWCVIATLAGAAAAVVARRRAVSGAMATCAALLGAPAGAQGPPGFVRRHSPRSTAQAPATPDAPRQ
jgi:hypothetical protein